MIRLQQDTDAT